jgi:hypothetical protein
MQRILKRLEALERAADKEIFADAFPFAIAYYLGGAKDESEVVDAYARALGYQDLDELCQALADLLLQPPGSTDGALGINDLRRASPAALAEAPYRIIRTLPEEWRATIKSAHRESCEAEARANELLKEAMKLAEEL